MIILIKSNNLFTEKHDRRGVTPGEKRMLHDTEAKTYSSNSYKNSVFFCTTDKFKYYQKNLHNGKNCFNTYKAPL